MSENGRFRGGQAANFISFHFFSIQPTIIIHRSTNTTACRLLVVVEEIFFDDQATSQNKATAKVMRHIILYVHHLQRVSVCHRS
jgi:hypothetical protein